MDSRLALQVGSVVFGLLAFVCLIATAGNVLEGYECEAQWKDSHYKSRYSFLGGCQVEDEGSWVPASSVRTMKVD